MNSAEEEDNGDLSNQNPKLNWTFLVQNKNKKWGSLIGKAKWMPKVKPDKKYLVSN